MNVKEFEEKYKQTDLSVIITRFNRIMNADKNPWHIYQTLIKYISEVTKDKTFQELEDDLCLKLHKWYLRHQQEIENARFSERVALMDVLRKSQPEIFEELEK